MRILAKLRAILTMGIVSGIFWGVVFAIGRMGYDLIVNGYFGINWLTSGLVASIGFSGGVIYATALALMPRREGATGLSAWQSALFGAIGGVAVMAGVGFIFLGAARSFPDRIWLLPTVVFAVAGAGSALAISSAAKRGKLPASEEQQKLGEG